MENKTYIDAIKELKRYKYTYEDAKRLVEVLCDSSVVDLTKIWIYEGMILIPDHPFDRLIDKISEQYVLSNYRGNTYGGTPSYEYFSKALKRNHTLNIMFFKPIDLIPLYINSNDNIYSNFSKWRLQIGV